MGVCVSHGASSHTSAWNVETKVVPAVEMAPPAKTFEPRRPQMTDLPSPMNSRLDTSALSGPHTPRSPGLATSPLSGPHAPRSLGLATSPLSGAHSPLLTRHTTVTLVNLGGSGGHSHKTSTSSTHLSLNSSDGPFTDYNSKAWLAEQAAAIPPGRCDSPLSQGPSSSSGGSGGVVLPAAVQRRSTSICVLERISNERGASRLSLSVDRASEDLGPQARPSESAAAELARKRRSTHTRRLSSRFNDIPLIIATFLPRREDEPTPAYLWRVFAALDADGKGGLTAGDITAQMLVGDEPGGSLETAMNLTHTTAAGLIDLAHFTQFFARLSGDNCIGPDVDLNASGGMGSSGAGSLEVNISSSDDGSLGAGSMADLPADVGAAEAAPRTSMARKSSVAVSLIPADGEDTGQQPPQRQHHTLHTHPLQGSRRLRDVRINSLCAQSERIKCVAMSSDPALYAVVHRHDSIAHIYNTADGEVRRLMGHGDSLLGIAFSPDRKYIATVSRDRLLVVWDCTVGLECNSVEHPGIVTAIAFSPDGRHVFTGCQDNIVRKMTFPKGRLRATIPDLPDAGAGVTVSVATQRGPGGLIVFSRSCDTHAYVGHTSDLSLCMQLNGHETLVWQTAFSSSDEHMLTCCERKIIVWRMDDFTPVGDFDSLSSQARAGAESAACLWTTAIFGPSIQKNLFFAFNTQCDMLVFDLDALDSGPVMDLRMRSSVYAVATADSAESMVCGDDLGNVHQIRLV